MSFLTCPDDPEASRMWAASASRSLLPPERLTRTPFPHEQAMVRLWWTPVLMIARKGDMVTCFPTPWGIAVEWVEDGNEGDEAAA